MYYNLTETRVRERTGPKVKQIILSIIHQVYWVILAVAWERKEFPPLSKCCPNATVEPELRVWHSDVKLALPRGSILMSWREGRSVCHLSGCDFKSPSTSFGRKKNTWNFFWVCTIARVLFYQCSPLYDDLVTSRQESKINRQNTTTMVSELPSSPAKWSWWFGTI
jgi:hypothetical protein